MGLDAVVEGYVAAMRPKGEAFAAALKDWCAAPAGGREGLIADVHKFAGSAGSAGFARLSAVATLIEIALRALPADAPDRRDLAQIACFGEDFADEVATLAPVRSSLLSGDETPVLRPFTGPARVVLAGLPPAAQAVLAHLVEQRLGFAFPLPDPATLAAVPPGRAPDLAVVGEPVPGLGFPVAVFAPRRLDALTADWPVE